jgi:exodeoxyribonuclease V alpha subunit
MAEQMTLMNEELVITATVRRVVYSQDGYSIMRVDADREGKLTMLGELGEPVVGQAYEFHGGKIEYDEKWDQKQVRFTSYRTVIPDDNQGLIDYLIRMRWVGPATARTMVEEYGEDTISILKDEPERVAEEIHGITITRAIHLSEDLKANAASEAATIECGQLCAGVLGPAVVRKAIKKWGANAAAKIKRDPYCLMDLPGVAWKSADNVYRKLQKPLDAIRRHVYAMKQAAKNLTMKTGSTRHEPEALRGEAESLLHDHMRDSAWELGARRVLASEANTLATVEHDEAELHIAGHLSTMLRERNLTGRSAKKIEIPTDGLADDQAKAVELFSESLIGALVGAPGTGKTYTLARILKAYKDHGLTVALCAPTGKAAKQMQRALQGIATGNPTTIHTLLKPEQISDNGQFSFQFNSKNKLPFDALIVDEASMIDVNLMRSLVAAMPIGMRLIIVGDHYQLPPVGAGAPLRDLLNGGLPHVELTKIKRNAGTIVQACHAIKDGRPHDPDDKADLEAGKNWRHLDAATPSQILEKIEAMYLKPLGLKQFIDDLTWDAQIISPTNERGPLSCAAINSIMRPILNRTTLCTGAERIGNSNLYVGDKVVRLKNGKAKLDRDENDQDPKKIIEAMMKDLDDPSPSHAAIVNGDIGEILDYDSKQIRVKFLHPDRTVFLPRSEPELRPAYAMTGHKMQGSECPVIVLPMHPSFGRSPLWTREWLYTAFSRAKKLLVTIGDLSMVERAAIRPSLNDRRTLLAELFMEHATQPGGGE